MKNQYLSYLYLFCLIIFPAGIFAQTTINTTVGSTGYTGTNSAGNYITFVIENNSGGGILITSVGNWTTTAHNNKTSTLWYSSTSLSGPVGTLATPTWTSIASNVVTGITSTGVNTVISGMSFLIPNNTQYRFALHTTGTNYYSGSGSTCPSPTIFTANGVTMKVCNQQINGLNVGYGATNTPRAFTGSVTFVSACNAPTGLAASNITSTSATLNWNAVSGSAGYEYVLNTSATPPAGAGTPVSGTTINPSSLSQATTYYMHVRNKCSASSFSGWVTTSFTTLTSCFPVTTVSVANLTSSSGTLSWSPGTSSVGYEWVINQSSGNPAGNGTPATTTSAQFSGLTGGATYYAHVRNVCGTNDKSPWTQQQFSMPECKHPTNVLISNITDSSADVLWSQMPNAGSYEYAVDFSSQPPTAGITHTTGISVHLGGLIPNSKYYLHIRSKCFTLDASDWRLDSFVTKMACYAPVVQVNHLGTSSPYAYWDPVPTAIAYEYAVTGSSHSPAFGATIYTPFVAINLDEEDTDYYLHVRSKCNSMFTFSDWSIVQLRKSTTSIAGTVSGHTVQLYPNPVSNVLHVSGLDAGLAYEVVDMMGRVQLAGKTSGQATEILTGNLSPAVYILKVMAGDNIYTYRFIRR